MKWIFSLIAIAAVSFGGWRFVEHQAQEKATVEAVSVIAPLIDYKALYEDGRSREANDTLLMTVAALIEAESAGADLAEVLRCAEWENQTPVEYSDLLAQALMRNLKIARELKLDTQKNIALMKEGRSPIIGAGPYSGEKIEVDHIVPRSIAPDLDNLLINLELMPMTLNRRKSDEITERGYSTAEKFFRAGIMQPESWEKVKREK